MFSLKWFLP